MANKNAPFGARVIGHLYGSAFNARIRPYVILTDDATALYPGDIVKLVASDGTKNEWDQILPACTLAAAGEVMLGVMVGLIPNANNINIAYHPVSTMQTILVCDDPNAIFEMQINGDFSLQILGKMLTLY